MGFFQKIFGKKEEPKQQQQENISDSNTQYRPSEEFAEGMFHDKSQPNKDLADLLGKGTIQLEIGEYGEAIRLFNKALRLDPNYSAVYNNKGNALGRIGQLDEALECYNKAIEIHPKEPEYYYNKAGLLEEMENYSESKESYLKIIELRSNHINALNGLALCYVREKDFENAYIYLDKLLKIAPNDIEGSINMINVLYELKRNDEADKLYTVTLEKYPNDESVISSKPIYVAINEGVNSAIQIFDDYYRTTENGEIIKYKANFLFSRDQQKSIEAYSQYLTDHPQDMQALYYNSVLYAQIEDFANQLKILNRILEIHENAYQPLFQKVLALYRLKRGKESIQEAQNLLSLYPEQTEIIDNMLVILRESVSKEEALRVMDKWAVYHPKNRYNIVYRKGLMYMGYEEYQKAIDLFNELNKEHEFAWNYYQIGIISNINGNTEECLHNLEKTFALDSSLIEDARNFEGLANLKDNEMFNNLLNKMEVRKEKNDIGIETVGIHSGSQGDNMRALLGYDNITANKGLLLVILAYTRTLEPIIDKDGVVVKQNDLKSLGKTSERLKVRSVEVGEHSTGFPVLETEKIASFGTKKIHEWAHFGKIEAEVYGNAYSTFGLGFFALDYSYSKEVYHSNKKIKVKISAFALSLNIGYEKKYWGDNLADDFSGYMPSSEMSNNCYYNFVTNIIDYKSVQVTGDFYGYILKVVIAKDEDESFIIDMFINSDNMNFNSLQKGMQVSGILWFQGELL